MLSKKEQQILDALEPYATKSGIEIVTIETLGAKKSPIIRIYIDAPDGVTFSVLSSSQAWIGEVLDSIDPYPGAYTLEVSSPGIDRPLRTLGHFSKAIGEQIKLKTSEPVSESRNFKGELVSVNEEAIELKREDGNTFCIPFDVIQKANVLGKVEF
jgi:ribosome maturation factor RimP